MCKAVSIMINWKLKQAKGARRWAPSRGRPEGGGVGPQWVQSVVITSWNMTVGWMAKLRQRQWHVNLSLRCLSSCSAEGDKTRDKGSSEERIWGAQAKGGHCIGIQRTIQRVDPPGLNATQTTRRKCLAEWSSGTGTEGSRSRWGGKAMT